MEEAGLTRMLLQPIQYECGDPGWPPASLPATDQIRLESVLVEKNPPAHRKVSGGMSIRPLLSELAPLNCDPVNWG